jgi:hypothetical protein
LACAQGAGEKIKLTNRTDTRIHRLLFIAISSFRNRCVVTAKSPDTA